VLKNAEKPARPLLEKDFKAEKHYKFDRRGTDKTPPSRYDFEFKDYAPWVFRMIRESFGITTEEYLKSLTDEFVMNEVGSPGKSGSLFYYSKDSRFIIKTIPHSLLKTLTNLLKPYYTHIRSNPDTLLTRIYGLHRVTTDENRTFYVVVMGNVFPNYFGGVEGMDEVYDLKGSRVGRMVDEAKGGTVLKDLNWERRGRKFEFGARKGRVLVEQVEKDAKVCCVVGEVFRIEVGDELLSSS
ncbi:Phosphatidylinositol-4-phosphate 5-kinase, partial [Quaeritorhiza haematococci]